MSKAFWSVGAAAASALVLTACDAVSNSPDQSAAKAQADANTALSAANAAVDASTAANKAAVHASTATANSSATGWRYDTQKDEMRGTISYFAAVDSNNALEFGFPYKGGQATLTLRQRPQDGLNVIVDIAGQFTCTSYMDGHVSVKFDDGLIERFGCAEPSDGRTGELFILGERRFLEQLKHSKTTIIEAEFYQQGRQQMIFDTHGLGWPPAVSKTNG